MKKLSLAAVLFAALIASSSAQAAKTFVGVLWPMFGPLPAIGLVELTAEIRMMPDVEVHTYLHQEWPDLVKDMSQLPEGERTIVIGYSLGANATSWVVNKSKYVDLVIALQPSMLSWNPTITGRAGRIIEVYNPTVWQTFGGMGSKKLEWTAGKIEYMPNNDSHPGAQFNPEFRSMVKTEIARMTEQPTVQVARADTPAKLAYAEQGPRNPLLQLKDPAQKDASQKDTSKKDAELRALTEKDMKALAQKASAQKEAAQREPTLKVASAGDAIEMPRIDQTASVPTPARRPQLQAQSAKLTTVAAEFAKRQPKVWTAFLDGLSNSVNSGNLAVSHELSVADMLVYAKRKYDVARKSDRLDRREAALVGGDMIVASNIDPHDSGLSGACCAFVKMDGNIN